MSLITKLKSDDQIAYEKWFERWYKRDGMEEYIIKLNHKGYKEFRIIIYSSHHPEDVDEYTQRRLRDAKFIPALKSKLGEGFSVTHEEDRRELTSILGIERRSIEEYILVNWGE